MEADSASEILVSDQPGRPDSHLVTPALTNLTDDQRAIVARCEVPRKQADLMRETGLSHRTFFRRKLLDPLLRAGLIRMARPDEPNHPDQAYVVTEARLIPARMANRRWPRGRPMRHGCHMPGLVTNYPGLVTEQSYCRAAPWSLSFAVLFTVRLAGADVDRSQEKLFRTEAVSGKPGSRKTVRRTSGDAGSRCSASA